MQPYFAFIVLLLVVLGTVALMMILHQWLGPRISNRVHNLPFECGNEPSRIVRGHFSVKFFLVALLFVLFDIELIFLFPWAVVYRDLGLFGFVEMFFFLLAVVAGLFYSVKRGAFEWN